MKSNKIKLKIGDILCFELNTETFEFKKKYGFAKVLVKTKLGDAIDVYDYFSDNINDYKEALKSKPLFDQPIILDGHSIFWKKIDCGKWILLENEKGFEYNKKEKVKFKYGAKGFYKLIDLNNETFENLPQKEIEEYPNYVPYGNYDVLSRIHFLLNARKGK